MMLADTSGQNNSIEHTQAQYMHNTHARALPTYTKLEMDFMSTVVAATWAILNTMPLHE